MSFGTQLGCSFPARQSPLSASTQLVLPSGSLHTLGSTCCENGRPLITDPLTGQTLCACQITPGGAGFVRLPGLPDGIYGSPVGPHVGPDPSAFYSPLNAGVNFDQERGPDSWKGLIPVGLCSQYDSALAGHPYANFYSGLDLNNAARRKNATRETTSALKAWLYEHRKNPYPTKGEKIMLAIITKMTLTQVSTWFANARRRLKKESKINWTPKDNDEDDCGPDNSESDKSLSETDTSSKDILGKSFDDSDDEEIDPVCDDLSDISAAEDEVSPRMQHVGSSSFENRTESTNTNTCNSQPPINNSNTVKPKIWSISNIIEDNKPAKRDTTSSNLKLSRPSILHYDSALQKDGTSVIISSHHSPYVPSTVSNHVIDSHLPVPNHTLETPPHTPPEGASTSQHVYPSSKAFNLSLSSRIQERFTNSNGANRLVLGTEDV